MLVKIIVVCRIIVSNFNLEAVMATYRLINSASLANLYNLPQFTDSGQRVRGLAGGWRSLPYFGESLASLFRHLDRIR